jgi:hypothetical protein
MSAHSVRLLHRLVWWGARAIGILVVALAMSLAPSAQAGEDGFTSPLIIPAADFESSAVWSTGTLDRFIREYGFWSSVSDELTCLMAPVYLPWGATITRFEAATWDLVIYDPGSSFACQRFYPDVEVDLMSTHMDDNIYPQDTHVITHASVSSTLNTGHIHISTDSSIASPVVNNVQQVYWVRVYVCGQWQGFQGVRIHYTE